MTSAPLITPRGESGFLFTFQDVTELKKRDREARVQQRLAAVGEMAAGIAHEIRNPLASMAGIDPDPARRAAADRRPVAADGHRAARVGPPERHHPQLPVVRQAAADGGGRPRRAADPHRHRAPAREQRRGDRASTRSSWTCRTTPVVYRADEAQIRQIVWNLATNGLRAMPHGRAAAAQGAGDGRRRRTERRKWSSAWTTKASASRPKTSTASSSRSAAASPTAPASACRSSTGSRATMAARSGWPRSRAKARAWRWRCPSEDRHRVPVGGRRRPAEGRLTWPVTVTAERAATASESARILVVDDERSMREMLAILLKREGHEVSVAENGRRRPSSCSTSARSIWSCRTRGCRISTASRCCATRAASTRR